MSLEIFVFTNKKFQQIEEMIEGNPRQQGGFPKAEIGKSQFPEPLLKDDDFLRKKRSSKYTKDGR